jgi:hypothetical protein
MTQSRPLLAAVLAPLLAPTLAAQCNLTVSPLTPFFGAAGGSIAASTIFDPDGAGPAPARVVVGGAVNNPFAAVGSRDPLTGAWTSLGSGPGWNVTALCSLPNGDLIAGGRGVTTTMGTVSRWNGAAWSPLATTSSASPGPSEGIWALAVMQNGDVVAAGAFSAIGGVPALNVARWNGVQWTPLGSGVPSPAGVRALAVLQNGQLAAAGPFFGVMRWDGSGWSPLSPPCNALALQVMGNGDLIAGGQSAIGPGQSIARWNGTSWSSLGSGTDGEVYALGLLPDGALGVGGAFATAGGVAAANLARWNGTSWSAMGTGAPFVVRTLATLADGTLTVGGYVPNVSGAVLDVTTTCPVAVTSTPSGCTGAGAPALTASSMPWLGSTFRTVGSPLPPNTLAAIATGFSTLAPGPVPIATLFAQGAAGCQVSVTPDVLELAAPPSASTPWQPGWQLALPLAPSLAGFTAHQQMLPLYFDAAGALTSIAATNSLSFTLGLW